MTAIDGLIYIDTSVLVSAFTREVHTDAVQRRLARQAAGDLAISDWVVTEFSSAIARKLRRREVTEEARALALSAFAGAIARQLVVVPVSRVAFTTAARWVDQHALGLRAADALHAAVCAESGATLWTLDVRLRTACKALGIKTLSFSASGF